MNQDLPNKPLEEAIFELRWKSEGVVGHVSVDPHYKLLVGQLFDRLRNNYPYHEQLPQSAVPEEFASHIVHHRLRSSENGWPLIQVGPGIATVNETKSYSWPSFKKRVHELLDALFEIYSGPGLAIQPVALQLRYIDAIDFDYDQNDIFSFLSKELKTTIGVEPSVFIGTEVSKYPLNVDLRLTFPNKKPKGALHVRVVRGQKESQDALIWETDVRSLSPDIPESKEGILSWVNEAHDLTHTWFSNMIKGNLEERFNKCE